MKIVSFPHYTCGGLLCDILNETHSPVGANGGIMSFQHSLGKIGDSVGVFEDFDVDLLLSQLEKNTRSTWLGTHCWLGKHTDRFETIVNVTTTTYKSKLYRWARSYHWYYSKLDDWNNLQGIEHIDKTRETAKNYLASFKPISGKNVNNLEFADIVEFAPEFQKFMTGRSWHGVDRWKQQNKFLYDPDLWQSYAAKRFYEAEYEIEYKEFYIYE